MLVPCSSNTPTILNGVPSRFTYSPTGEESPNRVSAVCRADQGDPQPLLDVQRCKIPPRFHHDVAHPREIRVAADEGRDGVFIPVFCRHTARVSGLDDIDGVQRLDVIHYYIGHFVRVFGDADRDQIGAQFFHAGRYFVGRALGEADQRRNGEHADDDAQHGQKRAHFVAQDRTDRHFKALYKPHPATPVSDMIWPSLRTICRSATAAISFFMRDEQYGRSFFVQGRQYVQHFRTRTGIQVAGGLVCEYDALGR